MKKPNFFIVGFPKCGTTFFHEYLSKHPQIFMPSHKELSYFGKDLTNECINYHNPIFNLFTTYITNEKQYLSYFKQTNEKVIGESSPWHIISKTAAREIKEFNSKAKILIIIREPVDLLYSIHSQLLYTSNESENNFTKALDLEKDRRKGKSIPKKTLRPSFLYYSEHIKFSKHIDKFFKVFPKKQIKIMLFDEIKKDNTKAYKDILEFLEVDTKFIPHFKIINANKIPRIKLLQHPLIKNICTVIFPTKIRPFISKIYKKLNTKTQKREKLDEETKRKLKKEYKNEVEKANKYFENLDLIKLWGYDKV